MVNSVSTTSSTNTTNVSANKSAMGKDDFLKLMIAQLKNQDPLNPMDGTAYASQLAQFSSLEQLTNLNTNISDMLGSNQTIAASINNTTLAALIGKDVKLDGSTLKLAGQDSISLGYELPQAASSVKVKIYNSNGALVKTIDSAPTTTGTNKLSWDLSDNNGKKLSDGTYTFTVEALDMNKQSIKTNGFIEGTISGVRYTEKGTVLLIDGAEYSLSSILEVKNPGNGG